MNKLIKLTVLSGLLLAAAPAFSAGTTTALIAGNAAGDAVPSVTGQKLLTTTLCPALQENVKINLSTNSVGSVDCDASVVGVATASWKGRGRTYGVSTSGGQVQEKSVAKFASQGDAQTAATTESQTQWTAGGGS